MKYYIILCLILAIGCGKKQEPKTKKPIAVEIATAIEQNAPIYIDTIGHAQAYNTVDIKAQVDGILMKTYFADGEDIKKGNLLYLIDQRPYFAALQKAKGALEESIANFNYAKRNVARNKELVQDNYISQNDYDNLVTTALADDALVKQNAASVDEAQIDLGYTMIYAPMDGRAGDSLIDDGNLILSSAETTLVTLNQITPIYVSFFVNENRLPQIQKRQKTHGALTCLISIGDAKTPSYSGNLTFIDNQVDLTTGMIQLKATLSNEDQFLWPNQYVKVRLIIDILEDAILIPQEAVQASLEGSYVFVLKDDQSVEKRLIEIGQEQEDNLIVVLKGIHAGEHVITQGQLNLYAGALVKIVTPNSL